PALFLRDAKTLGRGWDNALIYEAHVKGATMRHPGVPEALRGTYDAMASPAMLDHLTKLGVSAVELLPVQAMMSEPALLKRGLVNYWGYNTVGFFAPEPRYFGPAGITGFRAMVDRFHEAGIEVILDVVYNHSAESDQFGPTISFRGLDNASYYRLIDGQPRFYVNDTGCGNTLDARHPFVLRMILDSLRFWVECMGVDGFRFDLGTTLCRERHGFDRRGGFLDALRQDPVLM
ncbi:MAG: alpha-amylase family glycosyl hydrolase, partial [Litoreibacter sp.]|nr:alpha-amylase family glycosyl hydrolase [Litoreibacter sp.]